MVEAVTESSEPVQFVEEAHSEPITALFRKGSVAAQVIRKPPRMTPWLDSPLHVAIIKGQTHRVRKMIESGEVNVERRSGSSEESPLGAAAAMGRIAIARILIEAGADVEGRNKAGWTPLVYAIINGNKPMASLLIEGGALLNGVTIQSRSYLEIAKLTRQPSMASWLIERGMNPI